MVAIIMILYVQLKEKLYKMIILFSGKAQSGKDTTAKIFQFLLNDEIKNLKHSTNLYYEILLKDFIESCLKNNTDINNFLIKNNILSNKYEIVKYAGKLKQSIQLKFPLYFNIDKWEENKNNYRDEILPELNMSRRKILLLEGTEVCRSVHEDYWCIATFNEYNINKNWFITDTRFENEFNYPDKYENVYKIRVKKHFGSRFPKWKQYQDDKNPYNYKSIIKDNITEAEYLTLIHSSETSLDDLEGRFSDVIENNDGFIQLIEKCENIIRKLNL